MDPKDNKKPKWLRRLERESWQAELIISGAAIIGCLQLPGLLENFQHYLLLNYERSALNLWFFATSYWALFVYGLIVVFIAHFTVRALWIGLVGLNSVYPDGFAPNKLSSEDMQQKTKQEYGDIDGFITRLDFSASGMFGTGFTFAGLFLNLGLLVSLSVLLVTWLQSFGLTSSWSWAIGLFPILIILIISVISSLFSLPALREKEWVKRYHFPVVRIFNRLVYPVNNRFTVTGLILLSSQSAAKAKKTSDYVSNFLAIMLVFFLVGIALSVSGAMKPEFMDVVYHRLGDNPTDVSPENFADSGYDGLLYEPLASSHYPTSGGAFWAWVPLPERELFFLREGCTEPAVAEDLERREERKLERQRIVNCAKGYIDLYIDNVRIPTPQPYRDFRVTAGTEQFGVRLELTDLLPDSGSHVLKVVTHYPHEDAEEGEDDFRTTYIPFTVVQ